MGWVGTHNTEGQSRLTTGRDIHACDIIIIIIAIDIAGNSVAVGMLLVKHPAAASSRYSAGQS